MINLHSELYFYFNISNISVEILKKEVKIKKIDIKLFQSVESKIEKLYSYYKIKNFTLNVLLSSFF